MTIKEQQEKIDQAVKAKQKRYDKTSASILVSWATNCAVNMVTHGPDGMTREEKEGDIIIWRDWFIESYRSWMLENAPEAMENASADTEMGNKWQEIYNKRSEIDEINSEIPF